MGNPRRSRGPTCRPLPSSATRPWATCSITHKDQRSKREALVEERSRSARHGWSPSPHVIGSCAPPATREAFHLAAGPAVRRKAAAYGYCELEAPRLDTRERQTAPSFAQRA